MQVSLEMTEMTKPPETTGLDPERVFTPSFRTPRTPPKKAVEISVQTEEGPSKYELF